MTDATAARPESTRVPVEQFFAIMLGFLHYHAFLTAAELELPDHLANGPLSVDDLASRTNTHAPSLFRMMRALESIGVFKQLSRGVFANTPLSELLRREIPGSQWAFVRTLSPGLGRYEAWAGFSDSIRTGKPAFDRIHGCNVWEFLQRNPGHAALFGEFMRSAHASMTPAVTAAYDWGRFPVIADIGGGIGGQLVDILNAYPSCTGILFDQPDVIARAIPHEGVKCVSGSFFERVPSAADAYILRSVIHDWDDAEAVAILKTIRAATKPDSRVILVERVLPDTSEYALSKWEDLVMLVQTGGKERTAGEYRQLLEKAEFETEQIVATRVQFSLIVSSNA